MRPGSPGVDFAGGPAAQGWRRLFPKRESGKRRRNAGRPKRTVRRQRRAVASRVRESSRASGRIRPSPHPQKKAEKPKNLGRNSQAGAGFDPSLARALSRRRALASETQPQPARLSHSMATQRLRPKCARALGNLCARFHPKQLLAPRRRPKSKPLPAAAMQTAAREARIADPHPTIGRRTKYGALHFRDPQKR